MRLDHVLLAVDDVAAATSHFAGRLGMNAVMGGAHPGRGTHNSLVHFGTAYLELIGVLDPTAERARGLASFLVDGPGPYGYALAVADLDVAAAGLRKKGLSVSAPRDGSRRTPEGILIRWRSADLGPAATADPDSPPLPFLIEWHLDEAGADWMLARSTLARHSVPYGRVRRLLVATRDPPATAAEYERLFGCERVSEDRGVRLQMSGGDAVNPTLGPAPDLELLSDSPLPEGTLRDAVRARLARRGAGVVGVSIAVADLADAAKALEVRGVRVSPSENRTALIDPAGAYGLLLELSA